MTNDIDATASKQVSIICRSIDRPELKAALDSVGSQSYSHIEIILVDALGKGIHGFEKLSRNVPIRQVSIGSALTRSAAANAGLDAATGDYIMFLDDDDWIGETHVQNLIEYLISQDEIKAAYSSTQKTNPDGSPTGYVFNQEYNSLLLMRDNYIPIHAMLFAASLLEHDCRFDESFDVYEDWDFWLQLNQHTKFKHIDQITAFYREGGQSETASNEVDLRYQADNFLGQSRAALFDKWLKRWTGAQLNSLLGHMHNLPLLNELSIKNAELDARLKSQHRELDELQLRLQFKEQELDQLKASFGDYQLHTNKHVTDLEHTLNTVLSSTTWKLMGPARRVARLVKPLFAPAENNDTEVAVRSPSTAALASPLPPAKDSERDVTTEPNSKQFYDDAARGELDEFLRDGSKLSFAQLDQPLVSIILVFYNQAHLSLLCLKSIQDQAAVPFQLIIVDNNSTDATARLLELIEGATVIRNEDNLGFVKAVNQGAAQARGEFILLLNNDAILSQQALPKALNTLSSDSSIGAVGAKIILLDGSLQEAGSIIWSDGSCLGYGRGGDPLSGEFMFRRDVDYCSGAFLLFRRSEFEALDGFDEAFSPAYYEEADFCIRLQEKGLRVVYEPSAKITHYEFASSGGFKDASALQLKHRKLLVEKHRDFLQKKSIHDSINLIQARANNDFHNVLVVDDQVPYPSLGAGYPRCCEILNELAGMELNVCFYPLQFPMADWESTYAILDPAIEVILNRGRSGLAAFLAERENYFQVIFVSRVHNMEFFNQVLATIPEPARSFKIVYDAEAVTAPREILQREIKGERISEVERQQLINDELKLANTADMILAVSDSEADIFRNHGYNNVSTLGHSTVPSANTPPHSERRGLLFVGALRDEGSPNVDSLLWFIINVLPLIEATIPDIELLVVGQNSADSLASIAKKNVRFIGRRESIIEFYDSCRVFIAPTRFAAGIPIKVLEASACGMPVVATSLLAGQLGWQDEVELLVADDPIEFARQCLRLHEDAALWSSIGSNSLKAVIEDFSAEKFRGVLKEFFIES